MPDDLADDKQTSGKLMAWCRQSNVDHLSSKYGKVFTTIIKYEMKLYIHSSYSTLGMK